MYVTLFTFFFCYSDPGGTLCKHFLHLKNNIFINAKGFVWVNRRMDFLTIRRYKRRISFSNHFYSITLRDLYQKKKKQNNKAKPKIKIKALRNKFSCPVPVFWFKVLNLNQRVFIKKISKKTKKFFWNSALTNSKPLFIWDGDICTCHLQLYWILFCAAPLCRPFLFIYKNLPLMNI